jgi:hypothetical protein
MTMKDPKATAPDGRARTGRLSLLIRWGRAFVGSGLACAFSLLATQGVTAAQVRIGTVRAIISDASGALVPGATVDLENLLTGFRARSTTSDQGQCSFDNVPFDSFSLRITAPSFKAVLRSIKVDSNIPVEVAIKLEAAGATESVTVDSGGELVAADSSSTQTRITERTIDTTPGATDNGKLQRVIATVPGVVAENDGLLHVRAVDDGILYVIDGVPAPDRIDAVNASSVNIDAIQSITVLTGNIPAEFGGRSAAVVIVQPKSGIDLPMTGSISASAAASMRRKARQPSREASTSNWVIICQRLATERTGSCLR